jgi:hypothetical protein
VDATLRAAVAAMPGPSRPRRWFHASALPRTSGGKLHRDALRDLVSKRSDAPSDPGAELSGNDAELSRSDAELSGNDAELSRDDGS